MILLFIGLLVGAAHASPLSSLELAEDYLYTKATCFTDEVLQAVQVLALPPSTPKFLVSPRLSQVFGIHIRLYVSGRVPLSPRPRIC